jgi:hypothetical protein
VSPSVSPSSSASPSLVDWGGSAVDPDDVAGLTGWWKADALALSNNDPVASWPTAGSGGANYEFQQATGANQPIYKTGGPNGLPYVDFDGSNDHMFTAAQSPTNDATSTVIAVLSPNSPPTNLFKCILAGRKYGTHYATDSNAFGTFLGVTVVGSALPASGVWCILAITYRADNDVDLYIAGIKVTRTNGTGSGAAFWPVLGAGQDGNQQFANADIGEVCYYNTALSETDVRNVAEGLAAKWNAV